MTFQIGKFYRVVKNTVTLRKGDKVLCVDTSAIGANFYRQDSTCWVSFEISDSLEEWREPREWVVKIQDTSGNFFVFPFDTVKIGETIKLREVL